MQYEETKDEKQDSEILKSEYVASEEKNDVVIEEEKEGKKQETVEDKFQTILDNGLSFKDKGNKEFASKNYTAAI